MSNEKPKTLKQQIAENKVYEFFFRGHKSLSIKVKNLEIQNKELAARLERLESQVKPLDLKETMAKMTTIINQNSQLVGYAYDIINGGDGVYSNNADNFYLNTAYGDNNHTIYKDQAEMKRAKKFVDNQPELKDSDWKLCGITAGPGIGIKESTYAKKVKKTKLGESDGAVAMYYLYNTKTGEIARLFEDKDEDVSLGAWNRARSDCAQIALDHSSRNLNEGADLWAGVRRFVEQRVKELNARKR
ncbi:MAG: hypothetical protein FWF97_00170 [Alphaproteobacteria bacterium]|nr:hypothetical protein [Alphaproteobacteria bacterium]